MAEKRDNKRIFTPKNITKLQQTNLSFMMRLECMYKNDSANVNKITFVINIRFKLLI
jgi:hypothetical protein